ncbi:hypothetical protein A2875_04480 [Candidatus Gottesmanbacteria bacterium RIFCSPHIGHO2_01_FULL_46_14]|uniref:Enoyl reductase (ER) domain-containing protein n=2 Tax=Candidatus Gottesmaniibacteriota TaxID=1752720 RepID=A0A1F5ZJB7_9BACT|nr:MAG: hypothetical protein A2875_04480 [Candidatus Gottesmanbacteria bacterium RIFCSPHIGHO2_01_FULL_46_14]OGG29637.1 MAG: hypothetical protein A2971_01195 [Candidatus Gottesmanbacteria bacterium RIFCSPLOWO2_01_FULL_46_21]
MRAVQISGYGGSEVLEIRDNVPPPIPQTGHVLVEVHAAGINPFDIKVLSGAYQTMIPLKFPVTFGGDFAGVVTQTGEEVYGSAIVLSGGSGAFAQYACAAVGKIASKPKKLNFIEAAGLPVAGLTAIEAIKDRIDLQKNQKILIHGGAGGVGNIAIQFAKSIGAYVATTVNADDADFVKGLGADEVINYKTQAFEEMLKDFDAVLDTVGGQVADKSYKVLKRSGVLVLLVSQVNEVLAKTYGVETIRQQSTIDTMHLTRLTQLVDNGNIKVHVDTVFSINQVREAFSHLQTGHPRGKVVLKIEEQ